MASFAQFGNDLYTGKKSFNFVGRWKTWVSIGAALMAVSVLIILLRGFNPGIEFRGGTEMSVPNATTTTQSIATDATRDVLGLDVAARVSVIGERTMRVQTPTLTEQQTTELVDKLAAGYGVPKDTITASFVGASWGADVTRQALMGLGIFLVLVTAVITVYFRAWEMAAAAMFALLHDMVLTAGVYSLVGFEVTPAAVIGFLTILGYSLYDTVVVFDKVRENTTAAMKDSVQTWAEAANLAVNQTLVRSINTSVVAALPVAAILFIGAFLMGAGTLKDLSLALFVGTIVGTLSSVFIATPLLTAIRQRSDAVKAQAQRVAKARGEHVVTETPADDSADDDESLATTS